MRGGGARKDGVAIRPSGCERLGEAIVAFSGYPPHYFGWLQYRCLGAAALDLCAVAEGVLDGYAVVGGSKLGSWDYLGGMLVCTEAGAVLGEAQGRDLVTPLPHRPPGTLCRRHAGPPDGVPRRRGAVASGPSGA